MASRIVFTGKQQVALETFDAPEPKAGQVRIKTHYTLMSTGTENIVFNRLFDEGTHWDKWVKYPFYPGYCTAGEIDAVGEGVEDLAVGDRVVGRLGHASHHATSAGAVWKVPDGIDLKDATWFGLAQITFVGARRAEYRPGARVLVIGAGPIGQMSLRWARAFGAQVLVVCDMVEQRLDLARQGGATAAIARPVGEAVEDIKAANDGQPPDIVVDSTGFAPVLAQALEVAAPRGRIVLMGDTGSPGGQHLTSDVIMKGLTIVGAHDSHNDPPYNRTEVTRMFFRLVESGRFALEGLITDVFAPDECEAAYGAANARRGETMGIAFDWTGA